MSVRDALPAPIIVVALAAVGLLLLKSFASSPPKDSKIEAPPAQIAINANETKSCDNDPNCEIQWLDPPKPDHKGPSGPSDTLSRDDIIAAMREIRPRVQRCGCKVVQNVTIGVRLTVTPSGRVAEAAPTGEKAHTPEAQCVARAVRAARFPKSKGTITITYPFRLEAQPTCGAAPHMAPEWGTVGILVTDEDGAPLRANVVVGGKRIGTTRGTTRPTRFRLPTNIDGRKLTMRAKGFEPFDKPVHVIPSGYSEINVYLTRER